MIKNTRLIRIFIFVILLSLLVFAKNIDSNKSSDIHIQNLNMTMLANSQIFSESLIVGEIADTEVNHIILAGPFSKEVTGAKDSSTILIFFKGNGILKADDDDFVIKPESIALI